MVYALRMGMGRLLHVAYSSLMAPKIESSILVHMSHHAWRDLRCVDAAPGDMVQRCTWQS